MICSSVKRFFTSNLLRLGDWTPDRCATQNRGDVALVPVVKIPWVRRSAPLLKSCVDAIRERVYLSSAMFDVDWSVIENHEDTQNSTNFILDAELVRGFEVRRRQMAKREKAIRRRARNLLKKGSNDV